MFHRLHGGARIQAQGSFSADDLEQIPDRLNAKCEILPAQAYAEKAGAFLRRGGILRAAEPGYPDLLNPVFG